MNGLNFTQVLFLKIDFTKAFVVYFSCSSQHLSVLSAESSS